MMERASNGTFLSDKPIPKIGEVYSDTYDIGDGRKNLRTIKIVEVHPNGVTAEVLTDVSGNCVVKLRRTTMMFRTLRSGYELVTP